MSDKVYGTTSKKTILNDLECSYTCVLYDCTSVISTGGIPLAEPAAVCKETMTGALGCWSLL
jgi:hypothetical protein